MEKPKPNPTPKQVIDAITQAFPNDCERILRDMRWDSINGCYMFDFAGMYVGCELDGYIHS
jgi:hypothetical protein